MQARHYDPKIGRFIQADTVLLASMTTQGMNRYAYAENDPVNLTDPTGSSAIGLVIGGIILAVLWSMLKSLLKRDGFRCLIRSAGLEFLEEVLEGITTFGLIGWIGIALIIVGIGGTLFTAGWGFPVGGLIALVGFLLILYDRLMNGVMDAVVGWILGDARPLPWRRPKAPFSKEGLPNAFV